MKKNLNNKEVFLIDKSSCSVFYKNEIKKKFRYKEEIDPIYFLKAKKNKIEINNSIKSHINDGVALTKFIYWIKNNIDKLKITEKSAKKKNLKSLENEMQTTNFPVLILYQVRDLMVQ